MYWKQATTVIFSCCDCDLLFLHPRHSLDSLLRAGTSWGLFFLEFGRLNSCSFQKGLHDWSFFVFWREQKYPESQYPISTKKIGISTERFENTFNHPSESSHTSKKLFITQWNMYLQNIWAWPQDTDTTVKDEHVIECKYKKLLLQANTPA